ncbi:hypothetical protein DFH08DRAFT_695449 [Mycena albidolilacea]|uniref:DUF7330 domain-containing protein n=1 Tax=Mycena albidolilacea TaxID=1033008 RepID=A0AAD7ETQ0_9AGAR|nr:hypothetical protein DFH08DRAFT_695449 [Mycena albidolilacea]
MIVTEDTPRSPTKSDSTTPLLGNASGSNPPPAYSPPAGPAHAGPTPIGTQIPYAPYQPAYTPAQQRRVGEPAGPRFWKAFFVAFGVWLLATALFGSIADSGPHHRVQSHVGYHEYPIPSDVVTDNCVTTWSEAQNPIGFPYSASTSFKFPVPSKTLLLLSKGGLSDGHLKITSSSETTDVRVKVTVKYHKQAVRDTAKVCIIERSHGESGVGIFTPQPWRSRSSTDRLSFDVELILPVGDIYALSTDVSNFSHDVDHLSGVHFNDISLKGSNAHIQAKTLLARSATVRSSNDRITGTYAVDDSLDIRTSNGHINVVASINNGTDSEKTKDISLRTSNSPLDYTIDLGPTAGKAGTFRVKTETSNAKLTGRIVSAPLNSAIMVNAKSSNHETSLLLPITYEGIFELWTSNAGIHVDQLNPKERDPACGADAECKGRNRSLHTTNVSKRSAAGSIFWDKKNANRGKVVVTTSNSLVTLHV